MTIPRSFVPGDVLRIKPGIVFVYDTNMKEHHAFDSFVVLSSNASLDKDGQWRWWLYVFSSSNEFGTLEAPHFIKVFP